jgi:hypothetical protein
LPSERVNSGPQDFCDKNITRPNGISVQQLEAGDAGKRSAQDHFRELIDTRAAIVIAMRKCRQEIGLTRRKKQYYDGSRR